MLILRTYRFLYIFCTIDHCYNAAVLLTSYSCGIYSLADLASMMIQCSDLSASAKTARNFAKKSTVSEIHRAKPTPSVTYTESRSARQWSADQSDALTELFTLPGRHFNPFL